MTAGEADYSEIFTVCPDLPADDPRVQRRWPGHGPVPWPDEDPDRVTTRRILDEDRLAVLDQLRDRALERA